MFDLLKRLIPRSFPAQCGLALVVGILLGLGFGPRVAVLKPVGDILARVTLMLALPYLVFELTGLFGSLSAPALRSLTRGGGILFGFGLLITGIQIALLPLILPSLPYSPPFDPRMMEARQPQNLLDAFLPENIIEALAKGNFTALVLFFAALGMTLQRMDRRDEILAVILPIRRLFTEYFIVALDLLTPIGILGIVAVSIGTQDPVDVQKIVGLILMFLVSMLVNALVLYPGLYLAGTPFGLTAMLRLIRDPIIVSITSGNILLALPILCRNLERWFAETGGSDEDKRTTVDGLTAVASLGLLIFAIGEHLNLLYLPFAAWFKGSPLSIDQTCKLLLTALPASLGAPGAAISEGLATIGLPVEMLNLYFVVYEWITRIGCVETIVATTAGVLILVAAERNRLRWRIPVVVGTTVVAVGIGVASGLLGHRFLSRLLSGSGTRPDLLLRHPSLFSGPRPTLLESTPSVVPAGGSHGVPRRPLRVGIVTNNPPWIFQDREGNWTGCDIDLVKFVARILETQLELLPGTVPDLESLLASDRIDCVVGGIMQGSDLATPPRLQVAYGEVPLALLARDKGIRDQMARVDGRSKEEIRIAVTRSSLDRAAEIAVRQQLTVPETRQRVLFVPIADVMDFIDARGPSADFLLTSAHAGSALAILHPNCSMLPVFGNSLREQLVLLISEQFPGGVDGAQGLIRRGTSLGLQRQLQEHWFELRPPGRNVGRD